MTIDPLSEDYYSLSLYGYCAGNPVACRDENGEWINFVVGAIVGAATDYAFQVAVNYAEGKRGTEMLTNVNGKSITGSALAGAAGVGIGSMVNKGAKAFKLVNALSKTQAGKVVVGQATQAVGDAASSVAGSVIQGEEVTAKGVFVDVLVGQGAKPLGDAIEKGLKNTPTGVNKKIAAKRAQKKSNMKPNNQAKTTEASNKQKTYTDHGTNRAMASSASASNLGSKTIKKLTEDENKK